MRRHGLLIPEYTIDANGNAPQDKKIAESRFKRRKDTVNYYYKAMGRIYDDALSRLSDMRKMVTGPFRLPGAAIEDYKYEHNPEYREEVDAQRFEAEMKERQRKNELKKELQEYLGRDSKVEQDLQEMLKAGEVKNNE